VAYLGQHQQLPDAQQTTSGFNDLLNYSLMFLALSPVSARVAAPITHFISFEVGDFIEAL
jgi:hypothetical protein